MRQSVEPDIPLAGAAAGQRAAAERLYRWLAGQLLQPDLAWRPADRGRGYLAGLLWVEWPWLTGGGGRLRLGVDPHTPGLPRHWPRGLRAPGCATTVPVDWVLDATVPLAQQWLRPENTRHSVGRGTLGAILRSSVHPGKLFGLTAGHVLGGNAAARFGDPVALSVSGQARQLNGRAWAWSPDLGDRDHNAGFDAGLIELSTDAVEAAVDLIDWPTGWAEAQAGAPLYLMSRQHRLPAKAVGSITTTVDCGEPTSNGEPPLRYLVHEALSVQIDSGSQPGDSGAALWDAQERLVGLHIGAAAPGATGNAIASPIDRVLAWAACEPVLRNQPLFGEGRAAVLPTLAAPDLPVAPDKEGDYAMDILARTVWGEARGEPDARASMAAVAHVVLNRRDAPCWWGQSVASVCLKTWQFSCWNPGDPNRPRLQGAGPQDAVFALAREIAATLVRMDPLARARSDPTQGATHYHARDLTPLPAWARGLQPVVVIGHHLFYRNVR